MSDTDIMLRQRIRAAVAGVLDSDVEQVTDAVMHAFGEYAAGWTGDPVSTYHLDQLRHAEESAGDGEPPPVRDVDYVQGAVLFDEAARRLLGVSGLEFLARYDAGLYDGWEAEATVQQQRVGELIALLPHVRPVREGHYRSTACQHGLHTRCRDVCKFCSATCGCECHGERGPYDDRALREALSAVTADVDAVLRVLRAVPAYEG